MPADIASRNTLGECRAQPAVAELAQLSSVPSRRAGTKNSPSMRSFCGSVISFDCTNSGGDSGMPMQPVGVDESLAREVRARQQQARRARVLDELQAVRLVGQEAVAARLETEAIEHFGVHRAARAASSPRRSTSRRPVAPA